MGCCLLWLYVASASVLAQPEIEQLEQEAFYRAASRAAKHVVRIETLDAVSKIDGVTTELSVTSGVIVAPDGYIVSSSFGFAGEPTSIIVKLPNGQREAARIVSRDLSRKLVLLKVEAKESVLKEAQRGDGEVLVGQWAITVGRTLPGDAFNMSVGIVSARNRIWGRAIQIDANVSPTNYGGALVDLEGNVLGVLVPMSPDSMDDSAGTQWYDSGIGFAIPVADILDNLERLKEGDLHAGKLGISMQDANLYVNSLTIGVSRPKSPARDAGILAGDIIRSVNGKPVRRYAEVKHALGPMLAGDTVSIEFERDGNLQTATVTLTDKLVPYEHAFLGILPDRLPAEELGIKVRFVYPESPAARAGIQVGERIAALNAKPTHTTMALREALATYEPQQEISVSVQSPNGERKVSATLVTIPEELPDEIAPNVIPGEPRNDQLPPLGKLDIQLPEEVNKCVAYIPESYDSRVDHALLVVLPRPGDGKVNELVQAWKPHCEQRRTILLVPQAADRRSWQSDETVVIRKTIENVRANYAIDPQRIAVCGADNSGSMAMLAGFKLREVVRGVATLNGPVPPSTNAIYNEPLQRLTAYVMAAETGRSAPRVADTVDYLRLIKVPVIHTATEEKDINDEIRAAWCQWLDTLDRI